jgi:hypothetical protein
MTITDAVQFVVRASERSCVHVVQLAGWLIRSESFDLFHRDDRDAVLATRCTNSEAAPGGRITPASLNAECRN